MDTERPDAAAGRSGSGWNRMVALHKEQLRAAIGEAAVQIAAEQGLAGTTMSKIAERAGVSRATAYNYFKDVEHVLLSVVSDEVDRFYGQLRERLDGVHGPRARLEAFLTAHLEYFARPERRSGALQLQALGISPSIRERMAAHTDRLRALLSEVLENGRAEGVFDERVSPGRHAELLMHLLSAARGQVLKGDVPVATLAADLLLLVESGLCQDGSSGAAGRGRA
ncbi:MULTISPECIES: TetR/AcrR family transcriptional regulator [Streptomyces]|uniref:TetR/AcrR family transcriptional regulator n=1 Tax=Streptomyces TaxID=1883 RepID=UPI00163C5E5C|nr:MULTISPECIES: TetR/AcrR family transcriptional regulator [Streptomyces]MBC2875494.1 TetR/AcrR family transcriptional regulator [Streptomyces sp. TYQ1024]UBI35733.1 TetR/AcrR family transcriptional regulator [Streptomyces mobaraensis]UKW28326.1 TetR/AcrR family transcriptional regulator [Streptomyces sp. TYQ1024]